MDFNLLFVVLASAAFATMMMAIVNRSRTKSSNFIIGLSAILLVSIFIAWRAYLKKHAKGVNEVVHVDRFTVKGDNLYMDGKHVILDGVHPLILLKCKEEIVITKKYNDQLYLYQKENL